ncbi:MAG TPA: hypothetical protein EYO98_03425, partial [Candidatus Poseidoniales archaeon]|nr:hypothetical protein [Candidatus Poseidoniales archaeon]
MAGRRGLWRCSACNTHQTWKSRDAETTRLDRKCSSCGRRIRVTLDRSLSGRGRRQQVLIWEREFRTSMSDLEQEASLRNQEEAERAARETSGRESKEFTSQSDLPPLWGSGW